MEISDVEFIAQFVFRSHAELADLEFANFVGKSLTGPGDVAVDFVVDVEQCSP